MISIARAKELRKIATICSNGNRIKLYEYIKRNPGSNVTQLTNYMRLLQSNCSSELQILRKSKLVIAVRNGKNVSYYITEDETDAHKMMGFFVDQYTTK